VGDRIGIRELEVLKQTVIAREAAHENAVALRKTALQHHDTAMSELATTSNKLTALMQRRETWTSNELDQFTELSKREHDLRASVAVMLVERNNADLAADNARNEFMKAVQERYHTELLWQEKYRALNMYGTWTLISANTLIFVIGQMLFYRRESRQTERIDGAVVAAAEAAIAATTAVRTSGKNEKMDVPSHADAKLINVNLDSAGDVEKSAEIVNEVPAQSYIHCEKDTPIANRSIWNMGSIVAKLDKLSPFIKELDPFTRGIMVGSIGGCFAAVSGTAIALCIR